MTPYSRIFLQNPDGQEILQDLYKRFNKGAEVGSGIDSILQTYINDGQRRVLDYIFNRANEAPEGMFEK